MNQLEGTATVEVPEEPSAHVIQPQFLMFWSSPSEATVAVYFMENHACSIADPHAVSVGPDISLRYSAVSSNGVATASVSLRKIVYRLRGLTQRRYGLSLKALKGGQG